MGIFFFYLIKEIFRLEICRGRHDRQSCKNIYNCVNFSRKQHVSLQNLHINIKFTHLFGEFTHPFLQSYLNFTFSLQSIIHIEIYAVLWLAKSVTIYAFFVCKIFGTKIQSCKIFEEFQVWKYFIFFSSIGRWWWSAPASLGKR